MKTSIYLPLTIACGLAVSMLSGCATSCNRCGPGLFGGSLFSNQPVRSTMRGWFKGDDCNTCNAPAGQTVYSPNTSGLCDTCNTGVSSMAPGYSPVDPLYGAPSSPQFTSPTMDTGLGPIGNGSDMSGGVDGPSGL